MQAEGEIVQLPEQRVTGSKDFRTFFEDEPGRLYKMLYVVTGDRAEAADLMQEAFLKLWEPWDRIHTIEDPTTYLFKVALNGNRMRARAARRAARRQIPLGIVRDPFVDVDLREHVMQMLRGIAPRQRAGSPAWSPDGSSIAYADRGDIWLVPASGGASTRLTTGPAVDDQPTFSQDGRIAFTRDGSIWVMAADASHADAIQSIPPGSVAPRWDPMGTASRSSSRTRPRAPPSTTRDREAWRRCPRSRSGSPISQPGTRTPLGVETAGAANAPSWLSGDALLVERLNESGGDPVAPG